MASLSFASIPRVWRYYMVGAVNTLFGYSAYALLLLIGLHMYVAQITGHIIGVIFNYFTYSRHVFQAAPASRLRFVLSYLLNYLVGLTSLALAATIIASPYLAGLLAMLVSSIINFMVLRRHVFTPGRPKTPLTQPAVRREEVDHASL
jgi:putative flippase GtrA